LTDRAGPLLLLLLLLLPGHAGHHAGHCCSQGAGSLRPGRQHRGV
jgi:hypothetical protein